MNLEFALTKITTKTKYKFALCVFLIAAVLSIVGIKVGTTFYRHFQQQQMQEIVSICTQSNDNTLVGCLSIKVASYLKIHPDKTGAVLTYVYQHARDGHPLDLRLLSDLAHETGMVLSNSNVGLHQGLLYCGESFEGACMHGFVMERMDNVQLAQNVMINKFLNYCDTLNSTSLYPQCVHGVGHELWAKTNLSLNGSLQLCNKFTALPIIQACQSGVLMEYSKGAISRGHHSHTPAGKIELPCANLSLSYHGICIVANAYYKQYVPGWEPAVATYERCSKVENSYQIACSIEVTKRLELSEGGNLYL